MLYSIVLLMAGLFIILAAAEFFTNGLEVLGKRFSFSQAVVGNILSAVGTALPETILPAVAILWTSGKAAKDIGVGAILGAPFMISTLAFFLVGVTVVICHLKGRRKFEINVEPDSIKRDLIFFIPMYASAVFIPLLAPGRFNTLIALFLIAGYILYVAMTIKSKSAGITHFEGLHLLRLRRIFGRDITGDPRLGLILLQIIGSIIVMIIGARLFVQNLGILSLRLGMSPLLFALMLAPIATELPEKFNSITWTIKGKDALAIGNLTGAMIFQSTFPVSIGLLFTEWKLPPMAVFSAVIALISASVVLIVLVSKKRIPPLVMLLGGIFYSIYAAFLILNFR